MPIETEEKDRDIKTPLSRITQQLPRSIVIPSAYALLPIVMPPNVRPPPKPPNTGENNIDPHQGPDPRMNIEENSAHQEGIITKSYVAPDQSY